MFNSIFGGYYTILIVFAACVAARVCYVLIKSKRLENKKQENKYRFLLSLSGKEKRGRLTAHENEVMRIMCLMMEQNGSDRSGEGSCDD